MPIKETMKNHSSNVKIWSDLLLKVIIDLKADILVGDFMTISAALCAD